MKYQPYLRQAVKQILSQKANDPSYEADIQGIVEGIIQLILREEDENEEFFWQKLLNDNRLDESNKFRSDKKAMALHDSNRQNEAKSQVKYQFRITGSNTKNYYRNQNYQERAEYHPSKKEAAGLSTVFEERPEEEKGEKDLIQITDEAYLSYFKRESLEERAQRHFKKDLATLNGYNLDMRASELGKPLLNHIISLTNKKRGLEVFTKFKANGSLKCVEYVMNLLDNPGLLKVQVGTIVKEIELEEKQNQIVRV